MSVFIKKKKTKTSVEPTGFQKQISIDKEYQHRTDTEL